MKCLILLYWVLAAAFAQDKYTDKYNNINVNEIMDNPRLLRGYTDCILEKGACTTEGKELKANLNEAIETGCAKCLDNQLNKAIDVIRKLIKDHLEIWNELTDKYDPTGKWQNQYKERAKQYGIELPPK